MPDTAGLNMGGRVLNSSIHQPSWIPQNPPPWANEKQCCCSRTPTRPEDGSGRATQYRLVILVTRYVVEISRIVTSWTVKKNTYAVDLFVMILKMKNKNWDPWPKEMEYKSLEQSLKHGSCQVFWLSGRQLSNRSSGTPLWGQTPGRFCRPCLGPVPTYLLITAW